jgi:hypothetical protein
MKKLSLALVALLIGACTKHPEATPPAAADAPAAVPAAWLGKWNGPEGTWLEITAAAASYTVTVSNLDGPRSFPATAANGTLSFERDGVRESLHATDGAGTGMKWLAEKRNCIAIKSGEGFCRD